MTGPGGLGLTVGQTEPRGPGQRWLDRVAQEGTLAWCSLAVRVRVVYWIHFSCFPMVDLEAAGV